MAHRKCSACGAALPSGPHDATVACGYCGAANLPPRRPPLAALVSPRRLRGQAKWFVALVATLWFVVFGVVVYGMYSMFVRRGEVSTFQQELREDRRRSEEDFERTRREMEEQFRRGFPSSFPGGSFPR